MEKTKLYVGLDIGTKYAIISYISKGMKEPDTVSPIAGSEVYQIPIILCKRKGIGQWYYGEEAGRMANIGEGTCIDHLWMRTLTQEEVVLEGQSYPVLDLFVLFVRKLLMLPGKLFSNFEMEKLIVTMDSLNRENMNAMMQVMKKLDIDVSHYQVMDHQESFYYYALSQNEKMCLHDVGLFDYNQSDLRYYHMERNIMTTPQLVTVKEKNYGPLMENPDVAFTDVVKDALQKKIFSTVYLIGQGFDGEWMQESIRYLCTGRKVFLGKNLYSKGACYAAGIKAEWLPWHYVYMGDNEMKVNLSIKVHDAGEISFYTLISAGENWYEARGECEILLDGTPEIDFWLQQAESREAKIESLELTDLPKRPNKMTRLRIIAKPLADDCIKVNIKDLGFGEIYKSSEKSWEYVICQ